MIQFIPLLNDARINDSVMKEASSIFTNEIPNMF
jgi:hypothetical protein